MSKYKGLYTFDVDNHRYIPVGQADGIIDCFKFKHESKEPLIKDEKIRKAVRAWAELYDNSVIRVHLGEDYVSLFKDEVNSYSSSVGIDLPPDVFRELIDAHYYTIAELCGEEEE